MEDTPPALMDTLPQSTGPTNEGLSAIEATERLEQLKNLKIKRDTLVTERQLSTDQLEYDKKSLLLQREADLLSSQEQTQLIQQQKDRDETAALRTRDSLESFKQFLQLSHSQPPEVMHIDHLSSKEDVKEADAKMLCTMSSYIMLGINKIRSIHDVESMNRTLINFIKNRRDVLEHPLKQNQRGTFYLEPI